MYFFKELVGSHVELENLLKALEENFSINDSKNNRSFIVEFYSKPPKTVDNTNKSDTDHISDMWSMDNLDLKDSWFEKNRGYKYVLVVIESFSKFGWTVLLKSRPLEQ